MSESTAALYDRSARRWGRSAPSLLSDFTARPFLLEWCDPLDGLDVLDLGCGEGYFARELHKRGARSITGIDISAEMIAGAREVERREQRGIEYRVGDASELSSIADESLDLVVAVFLYNYLDREQATRVTAAVRRVLKPGGRFVFAGPHPLLPYLKEETPPFYFSRRSHGYFSGRDQRFEGYIWKRDGERVAVRCVHKTIDDYFTCLRDGGFTTMPDVKELHATEEHHALDPEFFEPLRQLPLHVAFRVHKRAAGGPRG